MRLISSITINICTRNYTNIIEAKISGNNAINININAASLLFSTSANVNKGIYIYSSGSEVSSGNVSHTSSFCQEVEEVHEEHLKEDYEEKIF